MFARKRVEGEVVYNDGEFAEVEIYGVEAYEEDLFLTTIQLHIEDTADTPEEFQQRFPVGMWLNIWLTTETTPIRRPPRSADLSGKVDQQSEAPAGPSDTAVGNAWLPSEQ
jgi:hypothetical protein